MNRVLVVDDRAGDLYLLRSMLEGHGWEVEEAHHGAEALLLARRARPDLVISDLLMPVMDGYTFLRHWKSDPRLKDIPFVVYTATYTDSDDEGLAREMGADGFIIKPAEPEVFMARLELVLRRKLAGNLEPPRPPTDGNPNMLEEYNQALVRKLEEKALELERANRQLRAVVENEPECVKLLARDGTLLEMNPAGLRMLEAESLSEVQHRSVYPLVAEQHRGAFQALTEQAMQGRPGTLEFQLTGLKGTHRWLETHATPLPGPDGAPTAVLGITRDITERKRGENLIEGQKRVLELIARGAPPEESLTALVRLVERQSPDMVCSVLLLDPDGRSLRHCAAPSLPPSFTTRIDGMAIGPEAGSCGTAAYRGEPVIVEDIADDPLWAAYRDAAEEHGFRACWSAPIFDSDQRVLGTFALYYRRPGRPTSEHRQLIDMATHLAAIAIGRQREEAALRASEDRQRNILDGLGPHMLVGMLDLEGRILLANRPALDAAGLRAEDVLGLRVEETHWLSHSESARNRMVDAVRRAAAGELVRYDEQIRGEADRLFWIDLSIQPLRDESGRVAFLVPSALVITERKLAEEALRTSEERFRQLAESIREVFWLTDPEKSQMLYISPAYEAIWGHSCESLYQDPRTWVESIHPEDRERVLKAALDRQATGEYDEAYRIIRPDGAIRWIHDRAFPIRDEAGRVFRIAGVAEDVTEAKMIEEQLRQSQKLEAIGSLAGGVAHDFNNILAAIMMQADMAEGCPELGPEAQGYLEDIKVSTERAARLTKQMLAFSRRQVMQLRPINLNDVVTSLAKMLRRMLGEDVALELTLAQEPLNTVADAGMVDQVLMNLAVNARDAMPFGGRLTLATAERILAADEARLLADAAPGRYVVLRVSDTGCGIASEHLERIFEPFFTTKEPGKGTGLGLATVFGIIKQHRGTISVESALGRGTTFHIYLPASEPTTATAPPEPARLTPPLGTETILLVEDDPTVRRLTRSLLERYGYTVIEAADGMEAMSVWQTNQSRIQLVLTDLVMPGGLSGAELAAKMQERDPALKIVFTSGYSADVAGGRLRLEEGRNFVQKPCPPVQLLETVRVSLDSD